MGIRYFQTFFILTLLLIGHTISLFSQQRGPSDPFISGDTFRAYADHIFDETQSNFNPKNVKAGDIIFVKTDWDYLEKFFKKKHPKIAVPYILITHNSDHGAPGPFESYLRDSKILAWFAQSIENNNHSKLYPIPIGIANRCWDHGHPDVFLSCLPLSTNTDRPFLCYMNFQSLTRPQERVPVWDLFSKQPWCVISSPKELSLYLKDLSLSKFVLSPRGNSLDCHRTWEALLMGAIPIVRSSSLDSLFNDLPVLIVKDWGMITESYLNEQYEILKSKKYNLDKLFIKFWIQQCYGVK